MNIVRALNIKSETAFAYGLSDVYAELLTAYVNGIDFDIVDELLEKTATYLEFVDAVVFVVDKDNSSPNYLHQVFFMAGIAWYTGKPVLFLATDDKVALIDTPVVERITHTVLHSLDDLYLYNFIEMPW
ncbi:hypothetical protein [Rummeliibacillus stabekisii]|uniref:hypothetical protein n=1 Tax=Rummeliibacillus stabekisii TaxID=241244 RepID=UPI003722FB4C